MGDIEDIEELETNLSLIDDVAYPPMKLNSISHFPLKPKKFIKQIKIKNTNLVSEKKKKNSL